MLRNLVPIFQEFLDATGANEVLDLGSGSGGPAKIFAHEIQRTGGTSPRFILTDLHPRVTVWESLRSELPGIVDFECSSVDATNIPLLLSTGRVRTIINAFHHLPPHLAQAILEDAVKGGKGIFISEPFDRNPLQFLNMAPVGFWALLSTPLLTPKDVLAKALYTWCTPFALALSAWDGMVSAMRMYSEQDLRAMVAPFGSHWHWEYGRYAYPPFGHGYYFSGIPR
ncbi:MAG: class I SAM-dependent methyltransferase [Bdellovibrio sp.]|nr:class I SAM-dependent methyltransferase [Bdellovibrio sp.]